MPGPYEGVHGFVFLYETKEDPDDPSPAHVIQKLQEYLNPDYGPVFFAQLFEGDFQGFAHFAADDLEGLVNFTGFELFDAGIRSDYATEGVVHVDGSGERRGPKRRSPQFCAICRVKCKGRNRPSDVLTRIADRFDDSPPFIGAARVIGGFQLLVELGADDPATLGNAITRLERTQGVARVRSATTQIQAGSSEHGKPEDSD